MQVGSIALELTRTAACWSAVVPCCAVCVCHVIGSCQLDSIPDGRASACMYDHGDLCCLLLDASCGYGCVPLLHGAPLRMSMCMLLSQCRCRLLGGAFSLAAKRRRLSLERSEHQHAHISNQHAAQTSPLARNITCGRPPHQVRATHHPAHARIECHCHSPHPLSSFGLT